MIDLTPFIVRLPRLSIYTCIYFIFIQYIWTDILERIQMVTKSCKTNFLLFYDHLVHINHMFCFLDFFPKQPMNSGIIVEHALMHYIMAHRFKAYKIYNTRVIKRYAELFFLQYLCIILYSV